MTSAQPEITEVALEFQDALIAMTLDESSSTHEERVAKFIETAQRLNAAIVRKTFREAPVAANDNAPQPLVAVDPADWSDKPVPARDWYADGIIPARNVTLFSGDGGSGKSLTAAQISVAGALGKETLGIRPKEGRVMYLAAEDDDDELHRRLADICDSMGASLEDLRGKMRVIPVAGKDAALGRPDSGKQIKPTAAFENLVKIIAEFEPTLLVLDTSADLFDGDEINRVQVRQFVGMLRAVAIGSDLSILLLSHPSVSGMQSGSGLSGSTAWNNSVRSRLYLTDVKDDDDARVLTNVKANYGKKGAAIKMRWQDGVFVLDDGKPSMATGLVNRRADETFRYLLSAINRTGQRVAPTKGINHAPTAMASHPDAQGITKKQFEAAMQRLLASGIVKVVWEGSPSKKRQRLIVSAEDFGPDKEAA